MYRVFCSRGCHIVYLHSVPFRATYRYFNAACDIYYINIVCTVALAVVAGSVSTPGAIPFNILLYLFICLCAIHINAPMLSVHVTDCSVCVCGCCVSVCVYLNANIKFMSNVCLTRNI